MQEEQLVGKVLGLVRDATAGISAPFFFLILSPPAPFQQHPPPKGPILQSHGMYKRLLIVSVMAAVLTSISDWLIGFHVAYKKQMDWMGLAPVQSLFPTSSEGVLSQ